MTSQPASQQLIALLRGDVRAAGESHWFDLFATAERHGLLPHLARRPDSSSLPAAGGH
jgi:hypothetical protein